MDVVGNISFMGQGGKGEERQFCGGWGRSDGDCWWEGVGGSEMIENS